MFLKRLSYILDHRGFPPMAFFIFFAAILALTIYYSPSWGLMDDLSNLRMAERIFKDGHPAQSFLAEQHYILKAGGVFRPVYELWAVVMYTLFRDYPTGFYLCIAVLNMGALLLWGKCFIAIFRVPKEQAALIIFFFPLSFFIFTPFWNIFMYLSLQEKFVIWFSPLAFYFFVRSYETGHGKYAFFSFVFALLSVFSKPTAIYLILTFLIFSFVSCVIYLDRMGLSFIYVVICSLLTAAYTIFTFHYQVRESYAYTSAYGRNLSLPILIEKLLALSIIIKILFALGFGAALYWFMRGFKKADRLASLGMLLPLGLLMYLVILLPWGYPPYLLCAFAPFVLGIFCPIYLWCCRRSPALRLSVNVIFMVMLLAAFIGIVIPRITKQRDIVEVKEVIVETANEAGPEHYRFYMSVACREAAETLGQITGKDVIHTGDYDITKELINDRLFNYLLVNDVCTDIDLKEVEVESVVFENRTWKVLKVRQDHGYYEHYSAVFPRTVFQKLITFVQGME